MLQCTSPLFLPSPQSLINPIYLSSRRGLLQLMKSLSNSQNFSSRTYFTSIIYADLYFLANSSNLNLKYSDLLLICLSSLILSAKYFEIDSHIPDIKKFISLITHLTKHRYTFTLNEVLQCEVTLLKCLQYRLQQHSIYSYTVFFFCHGVLYENDAFITTHRINSEHSVNKLLEKVYIHSRELMDYLIHHSNFVCIGSDCYMGAVAILAKVLSVIKGSCVEDEAHLFRDVYGVDVNSVQYKNVVNVIEEQYARMMVIKERVRKKNCDDNNKKEVQYMQNRKGNCNESMLVMMVPELRESEQCEGDKIFVKLLEEDVLCLNKEDNVSMQRRALSVSCESSQMTKMVFSDSNCNVHECKFHKESCNVLTCSRKNKESALKKENAAMNENCRKSGKSFTYCYDIKEFKHHIAKYTKGNGRKRKMGHGEYNANVNMKTVQNHNNGRAHYNYGFSNSMNCNNYNYHVGNSNNNVYANYGNNFNYYQQLHNTIIINNNIHINNYANNNNQCNPISNYVNIMHNNNINNYNYFNNVNIPQQRNNYYQYNNYYQQQQYHPNIQFNYKVNPYSIHNNNINSFNNNHYYYNKQY